MASRNGYKLLKKTNEDDSDFSTSKPGPSSETQAEDRNDGKGRVVSGPGILESTKMESICFDERSTKKWTRSCPQISNSEDPMSESGSSNGYGHDPQSRSEEISHCSGSVGSDNHQQLQPNGGEGSDNHNQQQLQPNGDEGGDNEQLQPDGGEGDDNHQLQPNGGEGGDNEQPQPYGGEGGDNQQPQPYGGEGGDNEQPQPYGGEGGDNQQPQPYGGEGGDNDGGSDEGDQQQNGGEPRTSCWTVFKKYYFFVTLYLQKKNGFIYSFQGVSLFLTLANIVLGSTSIKQCRDLLDETFDDFSYSTIVTGVVSFILVIQWVGLERRRKSPYCSFCFHFIAEVMVAILMVITLICVVVELVYFCQTKCNQPFDVLGAILQALNIAFPTFGIAMYFAGLYTSLTAVRPVMVGQNGHCRHPDDSDEDQV